MGPASTARNSAIPPSIPEVLRDPGRPLDAPTRAAFEPLFGVSLAGVRIHAGGLAAESARDIGALAYTVGAHIVLPRESHTGPDRWILAHELAHVVEQRAARVPKDALTLGARGDACERAASTAVARALIGEPVGALPAASASVQRLDLGPLGAPFATATLIYRLEGIVGYEMARGFVEELARGVVDGRFSRAVALQLAIKSDPAAMLDYAKGLGVGILDGVWWSVKGIIDLATLPYTISTFIHGVAARIAMDPARYIQRALELQRQFEAIVPQLTAEVFRFFQTPGRSGELLLRVAGGKARALGAKAAAKLYELANQTPFEYGKDVGFAAGVALFEIAMFLATDGLGNILAKVAQGVSKAFEAVSAGVRVALQELSKFLRAIRSLVDGLMTALKTAARELTAVLRRLGKLIGDLLDFVGELLGLGPRLVTDTGVMLPARAAAQESKAAHVLEMAGKAHRGAGKLRPKAAELKPPRRREGLTEPSGTPSPIQEPTGPRTKIPEKADAATKRALRLENETADELATAGYKVRQNPTAEELAQAGYTGKGNPDLLIEGKVFDVYSPERGTTVKNIFRAVNDKVLEEQTTRVVVNLSETSISIPRLIREFAQQRGTVPALQEVIVVRKGFVKRIYP